MHYRTHISCASLKIAMDYISLSPPRKSVIFELDCHCQIKASLLIVALSYLSVGIDLNLFYKSFLNLLHNRIRKLFLVFLLTYDYLILLHCRFNPL